MNTITVSKNIHLRSLSIEDATEIFVLIDENRAHLGKHLPWVDSTKTVADTIDFLKSTTDEDVYCHRFTKVIVYNNVLVGLIDFHNSNRKNKMLEIGYWLAKQYNGNGIMTKSCAALIDYAFRTADANRIVIKCTRNNYKSQAIPERLGFTREGVERQAVYMNGKFIDVHLNGILKDEWESQKIVKRFVEASRMVNA